MKLSNAIMLGMAGVLALGGCASWNKTARFVPKSPANSISQPPLPPLTKPQQLLWLNEHVIASDTDGRAIDPYDALTGHKTPLQVSADSDDGRKLLKKLGLDCMPNPEVRMPFVFRDYVVRNMLEKARKSGKPIVIFTHGGLNFLREAIKRAAMDGPIASQECYPIYICWDSSFTTSYGDHVAKIRNGVNLSGDNPAWVWLTAPVYVATDLVTSIVRTPRMLLDLARSNLKGSSFPNPHNERSFGDVQDATVRYYALRDAGGESPGPGEEEERNALRKKLGRAPGEIKSKIDKAAADLADEWADIRKNKPNKPEWSPIAVSKGPYVPETSDSLSRIIKGWALAGPKVLVLSILGGAGGDMWDVMSRRTQVMYHYEATFRPNWSSKKFHGSYRETNLDTRYSESTGIGCMGVFLRKLLEAQKNKDFPGVTLVGHSMGAMIFDEGLREFPGIHYENIVYLAAACSIRDFYETAIPYLERRDHAKTQFYGICLHPRAEDRDISFGEFVPRGSLLIWIDEFLGHPQSFADRRFGHFENALLASRMFPPRLQNRIHLTALSAGPGQDRLDDHGKFSKGMFWKPAFYKLPGYVSRGDNKDLYLDNEENKRLRDDNARRYLPGRIEVTAGGKGHRSPHR